MAAPDVTVLPGWKPDDDAKCNLCGINPPGPGGILCPGCRAKIEAANAPGAGATS
jgi:hypothetical protein